MPISAPNRKASTTSGRRGRGWPSFRRLELCHRLAVGGADAEARLAEAVAFFLHEGSQATSCCHHPRRQPTVLRRVQRAQRALLGQLCTHGDAGPEPLPVSAAAVPEHGAPERVEKLAENFASALLMPAGTLRELWEARPAGALAEWIVQTAARFRVSGPALKWRLVDLGLIEKAEPPDDGQLRGASSAGAARTQSPQLFNATFVARVHAAVEAGVLSLRKASRLLGLDTAGFASLCRSYGRQLTYEV